MPLDGGRCGCRRVAACARTARRGAATDKGPVVYLKTNLWFGVKAGGSVGHVAGVANALTRSGYPVAFVAAEPPMMVDANIATEPVSPPRTYGLPYELNNYRFQRAYERVATNVLGSTRHAFIYQRLSPGNYLGARLSRRFQLPLVVEYNGSEAWIAKNWGRPLLFHGLAVRTEQVLLTQAHLVVTVSDVLRDELIARGIEPDRIVVYPNCIDPDTFDPRRFTVNDRNALRATYRIPSDAVLCSFVGTFGQWHGVHVLAKAIARLWTDQRDWLVKNNVRFMLIGDGLRMGEVRAILDDSGATAICTLTGLIPQPETPRYLAASDILLSPHVSNTDGTRFFGSPTKLFEYMAMGKSIYASRLDQIADVLAPSLNVASLPGSPPDHKTQALAVLGQPGDENDIIAGVKFLVEHSDWSATLGANARSKALEKYTWDHHTGAILRGLAQLTGAK